VGAAARIACCSPVSIASISIAKKYTAPPVTGWLHRLCHAEAPQLSLLQQERLSSLRERAAIQFDAEDSAHQVRSGL